jgi:hypothetical protein
MMTGICANCQLTALIEIVAPFSYAPPTLRPARADYSHVPPRLTGPGPSTNLRGRPLSVPSLG